MKLGGAETLAVFSHPNHELAVLGLLRRLQPHVVFLTDGGGQRRVDETKRGLESIDLLQKATFLNHSERSFYEGLLRKDSAFFSTVAFEVQRVHDRVGADQVICDAVEYYNPVHDMTLPIVAHSKGEDWSDVFEIPLIFQKSGGGEKYEVQSAPSSNHEAIAIILTEQERASKLRGLNEIYGILRETLGALLLGAKHALEREVLIPAADPLRTPPADVEVRYERRAKELKSAGKVEDEIRRSHYVETVAGLSRWPI